MLHFNCNHGYMFLSNGERFTFVTYTDNGDRKKIRPYLFLFDNKAIISNEIIILGND